MVHAIPINDDREHTVSITCWCGPLIEGQVVTHHALDLRDIHENQQGEGIRGKEWKVVRTGVHKKNRETW